MHFRLTVCINNPWPKHIQGRACAFESLQLGGFGWEACMHRQSEFHKWDLSGSLEVWVLQIMVFINGVHIWCTYMVYLYGVHILCTYFVYTYGVLIWYMVYIYGVQIWCTYMVYIYGVHVCNEMVTCRPRCTCLYTCTYTTTHKYTHAHTSRHTNTHTHTHTHTRVSHACQSCILRALLHELLLMLHQILS